MEQPNHKLKTRKLNEILGIVPYGLYFEFGGRSTPVICDPSAEEIDLAIKNEEFEKRGFQSHRDELSKEWASPDPTESCRRAKTYHARRIAFFVVNGWSGDPIELTADFRMNDGLHRWRAAKHLGMEEVQIKIAGEK